MNRVRDYLGFAVWFAGLGYIAMWPLGRAEHLTLPRACTRSPSPLGACSFPCACVCARLQPAARRASAARALRARATTGRRAAAAAARRPTPLRTVKPRSQFGLRGTPRLERRNRDRPAKSCRRRERGISTRAGDNAGTRGARDSP